jgi:hypothetical protein
VPSHWEIIYGTANESLQRESSLFLLSAELACAGDRPLKPCLMHCAWGSPPESLADRELRNYRGESANYQANG